MEIVPIIERLDSILERETIDQALAGEINYYKGCLLYWQGQGEACLEFIAKAQAQIPEENYVARGDLDVYFGFAYQACGRKELALKVLREKIQSNPNQPAMLLTRQIGSVAFVHLLSGELKQSAQVALQLRDVARKSGFIYTDTWSAYLQGCYCFHTYDLDKARHHFSVAAKNRYILHVATAVNSLAGLVLTHQAMQQPEAANQAMGQLLEFAYETNDPANISIAHSCQARLFLLQGDLNGSMSWLRSYEGEPNIPAMVFFLEIPWITQCRVLVASGSEASLREAAERLEGLWQATQALHNTYQLIDIGVLLALTYYQLSRVDEALATLERVVTLAAPDGWIRPFVEPGTLMAQSALLARLKQQGVVPDYIDRILAAFDNLQLDDKKIVAGQSESQNLIDPLTDRELDVLELLAQRFSNKEIAAQLFISPLTVKKHTVSIYQKLEVKNRRQAVSKAIALGLVSDR
jgi:LuxR family maltose regulon positive regulatory protein